MIRRLISKILDHILRVVVEWNMIRLDSIDLIRLSAYLRNRSVENEENEPLVTIASEQPLEFLDRLVDLYMKILIKVYSLRVSCVWNEHQLVHCCVRNVCGVT